MNRMIAYSITILDTKIKVLDVKIQIWENELFLDELPNDSSHLVTIKVNDRVLDVDFACSHCCVCEKKGGKERVRKKKRKMEQRNALYISWLGAMMTEALSQMTDCNLAAADKDAPCKVSPTLKEILRVTPHFPDDKHDVLSFWPPSKRVSLVQVLSRLYK